ncbi:MAG: hypothetical protein ACLP8B_06820 [Xanthobacteraceae bacterium]
MITIEKMPGGYKVHATPPHVRSEWKSETPLSIREICDKLLALSAHQTDIGDAFYLADPNWISN